MKYLCVLGLASLGLASAIQPVNETQGLEKRGVYAGRPASDFKVALSSLADANLFSCPSADQRVRQSQILLRARRGRVLQLWQRAEAAHPMQRLLDSGDWSGIGGYVAVDTYRREIVVSFRGTNNFRNWITDVSFSLEACSFTDGCMVHSGFSDAWGEVSDAVVKAVWAARRSYPRFRVVTTGHSLGAAVATIATAHLRRSGYVVDCFTYGSPRVGNEQFVNYLSRGRGRHWRVTHLDDPVPRLPPLVLEYRHVSPEYWLSNGAETQDSYGIRDLLVCEGTYNTNCNGQTEGFALDAHRHYFRDITACAPSATAWKRSVEEVSKEDLEARLTAWSRMDREYADNMKYYYKVE
ncbi:hypothetical protein HIM_05483 [Hirsutella minnesotensis 3608]|uniref:Fungal lipase-type domain-containing protein n=1 Tax=Hirsutella minnesotensis 3608 TaxID=1043627 RepID=A0A0F8A025_9HYPO|nr:hypothetical protein HIM_05483 [Hirsutella minnesotensis 3608]